MNNAPVIYIDVPFEERVEYLFNEYGRFEKAELSALITKITKRLGADIASQAIQQLEAGNIKAAISSVLRYYDKTYKYGLSKKTTSKVYHIDHSEFRKRYTEYCSKLEDAN